MKTIQINDFSSSKENKKKLKLLKEIFTKFLQHDNDFHYLFEPQLIFRIKRKSTIEKIEQFLKKYKYLYEIYPYPKNEEENHFGEDDEVMKKYTDIFCHIFHEISVFYLTSKEGEKERPRFRERIIHILYNMDNLGHYEEAFRLNNMAMNRAIIYGRQTK